ncbi:response regulator transcription factor, partial [Thalassospira sp.]
MNSANQIYSNDRPLRILLCDDHALVMDGIRSRLECFDHINIIGEASNGVEALSLAGELRPDVVLMDISMPVMNGLEAAEKFRETLPDTKV